MAPETATHDRIYRAIRADIFESRFQPGARVDIQTIADRCGASVTPVREALYRLVGEDLVEAHPDGGFRLALLDSHGLANLYSWTAQQLLSALHVTSGPAVRAAMKSVGKIQDDHSAIDAAAATGGIFEAIAWATGNSEYVTAIQRTNHRLHYYRLAESKLFGDTARELRTFTRNGNIDVRTNVRRRIIAYHRRRFEHANQLCVLVSRDV
ncbi:GntR family transcriptional regulator [Sphingopyxis alaskensis]|jgi:DNA-binding GntR family transcriptional regulator|uniref:GntR family transcriptional regulator n=1 Tax=Sphingopyxis alaskensis TaxID=117207 RepID=UPI002041CADB|nr:GntR family transcriptional regulator [Sphingopyxis alaskensis]MCM3420956.1 GntR family transcriptional regulator [Sphingopyxis alaskensis]